MIDLFLGPAQSGILTDRECVSLFLHFTVNPKPPVGFMDVPRCSMTGKEQTASRYQQIGKKFALKICDQYTLLKIRSAFETFCHYFLYQ